MILIASDILTVCSGRVEIGRFLFGTIWWLRGDWSIFATGFGVLTVLLIAPGGISSLLYRFRDWVLTQLALKRDIKVPSLIADDQIPDAPPKEMEVGNES